MYPTSPNAATIDTKSTTIVIMAQQKYRVKQPPREP